MDDKKLRIRRIEVDGEPRYLVGDEAPAKAERPVMDKDKLQRLREAAEKATPGFRRAGSVENFHVFIQCDDAWAPELGRVLLRMNTHFAYADDAVFIAECDPTTVLAILDRNAHLESCLTDYWARFGSVAHVEEPADVKTLKAERDEWRAKVAELEEMHGTLRMKTELTMSELRNDRDRIRAKSDERRAERDELRAAKERAEQAVATVAENLRLATLERDELRAKVEELEARLKLPSAFAQMLERGVQIAANMELQRKELDSANRQLAELRAVVERVRELSAGWRTWACGLVPSGDGLIATITDMVDELDELLPPKADQ